MIYSLNQFDQKTYALILSFLLIAFFQVIDQNYLSNLKIVSEIEVSKGELKIIDEKEGNIELDDSKVKSIDCYYYYSRNKLGYFHELQYAVDITIYTFEEKYDLICKVKSGKNNIIHQFKEISKMSSYKVNFHNYRRNSKIFN